MTGVKIHYGIVEKRNLLVGTCAKIAKISRYTAAR